MPGQFTGSDRDMLGRLDEKLDALSQKVEDMNVKLYGNGKPGIIVDQALQQQQINQLLQTAKINAENIDKLKNLTPPKWLGKNWRTIATVLFLCFVVVHSILPADVSIWSLISKFFGG